MVSPAELHAMRQFFRARQFAVVGASADRSKFGNKVLRWYIDRHLNVTPVHPTQASIEGYMASKTLSDVTDQAPNPFEALTGVSIVTPPSLSLKVLQDSISDDRISGFWLQPGAADAPVVQWISELSPDLQDKIIYSGPCILVEGDSLARVSGRL